MTLPRLPKINFKRIFRLSLIVAVVFAAALLATFLAGSIIAVAGNTLQNPATSLVFTVLGYLMASLNRLSYRQTAWFLALSVLLSFLSGMIPGALTIMLLPGLLKRLKLV